MNVDEAVRPESLRSVKRATSANGAWLRPEAIALGLAVAVLAVWFGAKIASYRQPLIGIFFLAIWVAIVITKARRRSVFRGLERNPATLDAWNMTLRSVQFGPAVMLSVLALPGVSWVGKVILAVLALALSIWVAEPPPSSVARERLRLEGEVEFKRTELGLAPMARLQDQAFLPRWWLATWLAPLGLALGYSFPGLVGLDDGSPRAVLIRQVKEEGFDARDLDEFMAQFLEAWSTSDRATLESLKHPDERFRLPYDPDQDLPPVRSAEFVGETIGWDRSRPFWQLQTRSGPFPVIIEALPDRLAWR